jgi:pyridoxamine 5'-phosphate oxidase
MDDGAMSSMDRHDDYARASLEEGDLDHDPLRQFASWLADAEAADLPDPNGMVLSTLSASGPTSRTVLLKGLIGGCFEFVTNAGSRKGVALAADDRVSLLFPWYALQRQVLIDGDAVPAPTATSDAYWATRPRGSRIGAWASHQSEPVADRAALDALVAAAEERFAGTDDVPRPPFWGAWLVAPRRIEFWQGRPSRVHDRLVHTRAPAGWTVTRLQP